MSSVFEYIANNPQETQRLVGLKFEHLQNLMSQAKTIHNRKQANIESKKVRIIAKGGGRRPKLTSDEQILLTLVYLISIYNEAA